MSPPSRARALASVVGHLMARAVRDRAVPGPTSPAGEPTTPRERRAVALREAFEELGPLYVKVGQILSTRPDLVSETTTTELEKLHDHAATLPFDHMQPVLEAELGRAWRGRFGHIHTTTPLGTASLAQAYSAVLRTGEPVVVKVQRPGMRDVMESDMRLFRTAARLMARTAPRLNATVDVEAMLAVVFDAMRPELDFTLEARNMEEVQGAIAGFDRLRVPRVVHATPRVLIQTLAPGVNIRDADRAAFKDEDRLEIGRQLLAFMYRGYFREHFFHADPHPGNILIDPVEGASIIDWGMVGRLDRGTGMSLMLILINIAENDGTAAAKAWIEMGKPTPWADTAGFANDIRLLVPKISHASLADLNFGTALTAALRHSTRRGIQTSPVVSILGKSFANIDGSVRHLAPEIRVTDVFRGELSTLLAHYATQALSEGQAARILMELLISAGTVPAQARGVLKDIADHDLSIHISNPARGSLSSPAVHRFVAAALAALAWRGLGRRG
ncbi:ABC1 kinase family protein [Embleya sp. NPDC127516]|uniref:ABC1 kinase family protein n=1 Tax=Embleya sp. NPDC127516 TaxID=3363990 RepID=UPI0038244519